MRKATAYIILAIAATAALTSEGARDILLPQAEGRLNRSGKYMEVSVDVNIHNLNVPSTEALVVTPILINDADSTEFNSVGIYGRRRHVYYIRNDRHPLSGPAETVIKAKERPDSIQIRETVPYEDWMNGAKLELVWSTYGCCDNMLRQRVDTLTDYEEFFPVYMYVQPQNVNAEKTRSLSGQAYIDFPVNKTVIYPDYRRNTVELAKINATIDSVKQDEDVTIREVWLKGYASPESPYSHNTMLAKGRVAALKNYVNNLHHFPEGVITTDYEPEDWAGLKKYVEGSGLEHRNEILALIISDMDPDKKEAQIKKLYPAEYKFMLTEWYPALRHTDYRIDYVIRSFYDPAEIAEVMKRAPQKLNLDEFYVLSHSLEPGSDEFNEVWETAVRMFPDNETANLNAGLSSLQRGDYTRAINYLEKAGDSADADYARALIYIEQFDYPAAEKLLEKAKDKGNKAAKEALNTLKRQHKIAGTPEPEEEVPEEEVSEEAQAE